MDVKPHNTPEELRDLIAKSNKEEVAPRIVRRYKGVLLAMEGRSLRQIAETLGVSINSAHAWAQLYNQEGIPGLLGKNLTSPMRNHSKKMVIEGVKELIAEHQGRVSLEDITTFVQSNYNPDATEESVYQAIRRMGFYSETVWTHKSLAAPRTR